MHKMIQDSGNICGSTTGSIIVDITAVHNHSLTAGRQQYCNSTHKQRLCAEHTKERGRVLCICCMYTPFGVFGTCQLSAVKCVCVFTAPAECASHTTTTHTQCHTMKQPPTPSELCCLLFDCSFCCAVAAKVYCNRCSCLVLHRHNCCAPLSAAVVLLKLCNKTLLAIVKWRLRRHAANSSSFAVAHILRNSFLLLLMRASN
jgi:hypothetical protein